MKVTSIKRGIFNRDEVFDPSADGKIKIHVDYLQFLETSLTKYL